MMPPVSGNTALFLDIDGTLLDMARTPDRVRVPGDLRRALERLAHDLGGALAFVSGRSLDSIDSLFAPFRPAAIGAHGGEIRGADGAVARVAPLPDSVREVFTGLAGAVPGLLLEDKICALALHYRLAPEARSALEAAMEKHARLFAAENVNILHGKAVIEARPVGVDKGWAVTRLPHSFEWFELVVGVPLILGTFGAIIWYKGFNQDDRALFRKNEVPA